MNISDLKSIILDLFFPNRCPLCGKVVNWQISYCDKCYENLSRTGDELCHGCGNIASSCSCDEENFSFLRCYAAFYYEDVVKSAIVYLKHTPNDIFPGIVAEKILQDMESDCYKFKADCVVPVPMAKLKRNQRGFNQADVLAKALADALDIPLEANVLKKRNSLVAQHELTAESRRRNVKHLYEKTDTDKLKGKIVILCDDVMTTGSTLNECSKLLIEMGAAAVIIAVAATTIK